MSDTNSQAAVAETMIVTDIGAAIFESSNDCVKMLDRDGHLLSMNKNGQCMMEIDDFLVVEGLPWTSVWPAESSGAIRHALGEARAGRTGHFEAFCPTAKATPKWWDVIVTPVVDGAGRLEKILAISRDITDVRRANEQLRASRERFSLLLESSTEGIYGIGPDHICTFINGSGARMLGYEPGELIGRQLHPVIHHSRADGTPYPWEQCRLSIAAAAGLAVRIEDEVFWHRGGHAIPVSYTVAPMAGEGGNGGAVVTFTDITERKRTQKALQSGAERLRVATDAAELGLWTWDPGTDHVTWENPRAFDILGIPASSAPVNPAHFAAAFLHPEDIAGFEHAVSVTLAEDRRFKFEGRVLRKDGTVRWVELYGRSQPRSAASAYLVGTIADITERKEVEEKLRDADRRKDEFLAMLAHELRNPLAPIGAAAELLKTGKLDAERVRKTSEIISRQVSHMTNLVDDLLDVSRVTRGLVTLEKVALDMRHIVTDAVEQVSPLIQQKRHTLTLHLIAGVTTVMGDNKRLVQIVSNLLNNAAKYTPSGGNIALRTEVEAGMVILTVSDDGIGIERQLAGRVFELFTQAEHTPDRSSGGLGLGLALVKNLVELHGGTVGCVSAGAGRGSIFRVALPRLAPDGAGPAAAAATATARQHGTGATPLRILLVDDNIDAAMMLGMLLEASGHALTVVHAASGALARIETQAFDVCLLDIGLPEMDGNELARRLRLHPATQGCILIAITGYGQQSDRRDSAQAGFDHHFIKPVDTHQLLAVLAEAGSARGVLAEAQEVGHSQMINPTKAPS